MAQLALGVHRPVIGFSLVLAFAMKNVSRGLKKKIRFYLVPAIALESVAQFVVVPFLSKQGGDSIKHRRIPNKA